MTSAQSENHEGHFPTAGLANDGWSTESEATATCYCGAVQIAFPTKAPGLIRTFVCHCTDCRKITASMFATNMVVSTSAMTHLRGESNLTVFAQEKTTTSGQQMSSHFCSTCGTLMYRRSARFPGMSAMRVGTVDDFKLHETNLFPTDEDFVKDRVSWLKPVEGSKQN